MLQKFVHFRVAALDAMYQKQNLNPVVCPDSKSPGNWALNIL